MGGGRAPCCDKSKVRSGPWSLEEDSKLINFIQIHGHGNWRALPKQAGLLRCGKSCRLRWINYLRPDIKRGNFKPEEEQTIINLHNSIGNKWSKIASCLPGRTDNEIKNVWNTRLKKRIIKTEAKESKKSYSASKSCTPSSTTSTSGGDDKLLKVISTHPNDPKESKETTTSDSVASSHALNEALGFSTSVANNEADGCTLDDGIIEIPSEFDIDFWELSDSLDPLQSTENEQNGENQGSEVELAWLNI